VSADLHVEAILERGDDAAAAGVVLGVGGGHHHDVDRQAHLVALDLQVALLHQVEQSHLHFLGEIGQLVDGEDAAMGTRHQTEVDGFLVGHVAAFGDLDGVDLADEVGDGHVGRRQLLAVAGLAPHPGQRQILAEFGRTPPARSTDRRGRVVVDLAAFDHRHPLVQQRRQRAHQTGLALAALAQQHHVVTAENGVLDLGYHRVLVADDAGEQ
jgi:hypothetical protein